MRRPEAGQKLAVMPLSSILLHGWQTAVETCDGLPVTELATHAGPHICLLYALAPVSTTLKQAEVRVGKGDVKRKKSREEKRVNVKSTEVAERCWVMAEEPKKICFHIL